MTLSALRSWLSTLAEAHALVPASEVLDRLPATTGAGDGTLAALTVEQAGKLLGRSASTTRDYARQGLLPGAYRQQRREWRIPPGAIGAFQRRQYEEAQAAAKTVTSNGKGSTDLSAWRKEIDAA